MSSGGGKGGFTGSTTSTNQSTQNYLDFQRPLIDQVYGALSPNLLALPDAAGSLLSDALRGASLSISGDDPVTQRIRSVEDLVNDQLGRQPYEEVVGLFKDFLDRGDGANVNPAIGLFQSELQGFTPNEALALFRGELAGDRSARATDLLLPTARGDFLFANPYTDQLVGNVTNDITRAFERSVLPGVTSSFGLAGRTRNNLLADAVNEAGRKLAEETGRAASNLRGQIYESERDRQLSAAGQVGQLDAQEGTRRLQSIANIGDSVNADRSYRSNLISGIGNLSNADVANRLAAAQGVLAAVQADEARRASLVGARTGIADLAADQYRYGITSAPGLVSAYTTLPFLPLDNFFKFASAPLGSQVSGSTSSTKDPFEIFDSLLSSGVKLAALA